MTGRLRALRVVHPFPSFLNSALVLALALVAGGTVATAVLLALGMLGLQFSIGTINDVADEALDAATKTWKPIPAGLVSSRSALVVGSVSGGLGLLFALSQGVPEVAMALVMLGCGLLYDLRLKRTVFAWACYSVAFAVLPIYAWYGAVGQLPPLAQFVIPVAALAGPALQLSNGLIDLERDRAGGIHTLATRLGRRATLVVVVALVGAIYVLAWATLVGSGEATSRVVVAVATVVAFLGLVFSASRSPATRSAGWTAQAVAIALLAWGWLAAI
jgi:4-hydroxybenzoate polyprenyltransferase